MFILPLFITLILGAVTLGAPAEDLIVDLPGLEFPITYQQYSGYLNGTDGRKLHYWFVESQGNPATDPLVLWLNGGPGCSSLMGFLTELGPFRVNTDNSNTLVPNVYSWNTLANIVFLESPACVGFSYDENNNCQTGDKEVADMNYLALQDFFGKFPEYLAHEFFVTGESYGGIYVPTLSEKIVQGQDTFPLNFQGYAIGNGLTTYDTNDNSLLFFGYYHALLGETQWENLVAACCDGGVDNQASCNFVQNTATNCQVLVNAAFVQIYDMGLNVYNLYGYCPHPAEDSKPTEYTFDRRNLFRTLRNKFTPIEPFSDPPCTDNSRERTYLNTPAVRDALHIPASAGDWDVCSDEVGNLYQREYSSSMPQISSLQSGGIRGLIYNGDVDMACNFLGNTWDIADLALPTVENRRQWNVADQVSGYVVRYENLDFVTVKGSGHMVPTDKPQEALHMFATFLNNEPI